MTTPASATPQLSIGLSATPFAPLQRLEAWQQQLAQQGLIAAAESQFIGRVRPMAGDGSPLAALELAHYPGMTEHPLQPQ
ncbi:MAG: molybdenum cofactor biosynthesis protein MoaE, partial [Vulcanococcus sp.]